MSESDDIEGLLRVGRESIARREAVQSQQDAQRAAEVERGERSRVQWQAAALRLVEVGAPTAALLEGFVPDRARLERQRSRLQARHGTRAMSPRTSHKLAAVERGLARSELRPTGIEAWYLGEVRESGDAYYQVALSTSGDIVMAVRDRDEPTVLKRATPPFGTTVDQWATGPHVVASIDVLVGELLVTKGVTR